MRYNWKAIPEATWTAFAAAFAGLAGALMVAGGSPEYLIVAVTVFIAAGFRIIVAFLGALGSDTGTISSGTGAVDATPIPPTGESGQSTVELLLIVFLVIVILIVLGVIVV